MGAQLEKEHKQEVCDLVSKLSLSEEITLKSLETFAKFCKGNRTTMTKEDFKEFLASINIENITDAMLDSLFQVVDSNSDGEISAVEFMRYFLLLMKVPTKTKLKIVFEIIDRDGSGTIELAELKRFYNDLATSRAALMNETQQTNVVKLDEAEIEKMFQKMDVDHDGKVTLSEFVSFSKLHGPYLLRLLDAYWETDIPEQLSSKILKKTL